MKINTKYGEVELVASKRINTYGAEIDVTEIIFNNERIGRFGKKTIAFFEGLSEEDLEEWAWDIEERIESFNEQKRDIMRRNDCIQALWSACRKHGMETIYRLICSLHSCEGAAQQNIYDYINRIR